VKIKVKESCGREFLSYGRIFIKKGQEKEYEDSQELRSLINTGYVEIIDNEIPKVRGRKKKAK
jgi:hypothetical protein